MRAAHRPSQRGCLWAAGIFVAVLAAVVTVWIVSGGFYYGIGLAHRPVRFAYSQAAHEGTRTRAAAIVAALERWQRTHHEYPERLEDLVPGELPALEKPQVGDGVWQYTRLFPGRFTLSFFVGPLYEGDHYDSDTGSWYVDR